MKPPPEPQALQAIALRLGELVPVRPGQAKCQLLRDRGPVDAEVRVAGQVFLVEWKSSGDAAAVGAAVRQLERAGDRRSARAVLMVAVPYMGQAGRRICEEQEVNWMDLSGNARLDAPGLHVRVEGKPNRYKRRGRPSSPFAPKSARISRWFLMHPEEPISQRELASAVDMEKGFVSRVVRRLEDLELLARVGAGSWQVRDPRLLLEAWAEQYDFEQHFLLRGHVPARSGSELLARVAGLLGDEDIPYSATGLSGAWLLTGTAAFRTCTFFVSRLPDEEALGSLWFQEDPEGANLWLAVPKDEGVFHGAQERNGVSCSHPVQVWMDLKAHPERAKEAAEELANRHLPWMKHG